MRYTGFGRLFEEGLHLEGAGAPPEDRGVPAGRLAEGHRYVLGIRSVDGSIGRSRRLLGGIALAASLALGPTTGTAQELQFFRIGTGTTGGTYFPIGGLIASAISNPPGSRPCERGGSCGVPGLIAIAQATSGSVENVDLLQTQSLESALAQADIAYWASRGEGPYEGQPPMDTLRSIANLYSETLHVVVRADSDIHGIEDLRGKTVSLGDKGSGTLVEARLLLDAYGLSEEDDLEAQYLRLGPAADRLAEGAIDALIMVGGQPLGAIADLAERIPIRLIPVADDKADRLADELSFIVETVIPAGVYKGVPETRTLGVGAQWLVRADTDPELVHGITRALWHPSTLRLLESGHPRGGELDPRKALEGLAVPLHPGAEQFYREAGLMDGAAGDGTGSDETGSDGADADGADADDAPSGDGGPDAPPSSVSNAKP